MLRTGAGGEIVQLLRKLPDGAAERAVLRDGGTRASDVECYEVPLKHAGKLRGQGVVQADMHDSENSEKKVWRNKNLGGFSHENAIKAF